MDKTQEVTQDNIGYGGGSGVWKTHSIHIFSKWKPYPFIFKEGKLDPFIYYSVIGDLFIVKYNPI